MNVAEMPLKNDFGDPDEIAPATTISNWHDPWCCPMEELQEVLRPQFVVRKDPHYFQT